MGIAPRFYLGIDPGFSGAIAMYCPETGVVNVADMPVMKDAKGRTVIDNLTLYEMLLADVVDVKCHLELVASRPNQSAPAMFRFGEGYGAVKMALAANRIPFDLVAPTTWKKHFGLSSDKGASRGLVMTKFPKHSHLFQRVKDDGRAEALLLAVHAHEKDARR